MNNTHLIDKSYSPEKRFSHFVSILINLNGFSFSVFDISMKNFVEYKSIKIESSSEKSIELCNKFIGQLKTEFESGEHYTQIACIIESPKATIVPEVLFIKDRFHEYFQFNQDLNNTESVYFDSLKNSENENIFSFPTCLIKNTQEFFPNIKIFHQSSIFIEEIFLRNKKKLINTKCFVLANHDYFEILVISPSKILLHNTFHYSGASDFTYFVLNIYEQLRLSPEIHPIELYGSIEKNSDIYFSLKKYIKTIEFANCNNEFIISQDLINLHPHNLLNHYFLFKCAS